MRSGLPEGVASRSSTHGRGDAAQRTTISAACMSEVKVSLARRAMTRCRRRHSGLLLRLKRALCKGALPYTPDTGDHGADAETGSAGTVCCCPPCASLRPFCFPGMSLASRKMGASGCTAGNAKA